MLNNIIAIDNKKTISAKTADINRIEILWSKSIPGAVNYAIMPDERNSRIIVYINYNKAPILRLKFENEALKTIYKGVSDND